jgi:H+/gluconate symporter-like permease
LILGIQLTNNEKAVTVAARAFFMRPTEQKIGIPIVAGLLAVHCIVPPRPAAAITILLKADSDI